MTTIKSMWCPVTHTHVTCIVDLEGTVVRVVCYDYEEATRTCRVKRRASRDAPLGQLLARSSEEPLADSSVSCPVA